MRLDPDEAAARFSSHDHGVFCTLHPQRGIDAVPCIYAADLSLVDPGEVGRIGVPVDTVKPKASTRLQRERNLEADPRGTLLVENWDREDWSRLWWVRAALRWEPDPAPEVVAALADRLARTVPQYRDQPFARVMVLRVVTVTGWEASGPPSSQGATPTAL